MARAKFRDAVLSRSGRPIGGATVTVRQPGTSTPITETIYNSAGSVLANPLTVTATGEIEFYLDEPKRVDLLIAKTGYTSETQQVDVLRAENGRYSKSLDEVFAVADHVFVTDGLLKGVFVPEATSVEVDVAYNGFLQGIAHVSSYFFWNQEVDPGTDLLNGKGLLDATEGVVDGTSKETVGPSSAAGGIGKTSRRVRLSGLTPGEPVTWELGVGCTGYYEKLAVSTVGNVLIDLVMSLDARKVYVTDFTDGKVVVVKAANEWSVDGPASEIETEWTGHSGAYGILAHPTDSTKLYLSEFSTNNVLELNATTGATIRTFAMGGAPQWMAVTPDGTKLYVVVGNAIKPVTLASGTVGSAISVGNTPGLPIVVGTHVYIPCAGTGDRIDKVRISDDTNVGNLALGADCNSISATPDGTKIWTAEEANRIREVSVSSFALTGTQFTGLTGQPKQVAVSPTGKSLIAVGAGGTDEWWSFVLPSKGAVYESVAGVVPGAGWLSRMLLDTYGDVWTISTSHTTELHHWQCARLDIDPTSVFWGSFAEVVVTPATAGEGD